ncbi:2-amino-4-hydroxy-6-hydroxymethyldihydropteridine diphosphokinase [Treponema pectinovorum]|uniref:2-amino-4-hydroxy-6- hydroxymethyldihydropteridine diphosphokinase n=1 Tax=Treponema pectinovorum TaxID=164 RepID=UPI0011C73214|nr:2-amino-4-hydroxy-6-hydroxymethyldihydropteridine diphosphokinase [Treponema pectinovorum]
MTDVILGLGSNKTWKDKSCEIILKMAFDKLSLLLSGITASSVYRTKPMYYTEQEDFFNLFVRGKIDSSLPPQDLLFKIHKIEESLGRDRTKEIRNGPRSIDIDIEFFGNTAVVTKDLQIPHPRIFERAFVLIPMLEILNESADFISRDVFVHYVNEKGSQGVEKYLSAQEFLNLKAQYGTGS